MAGYNTTQNRKITSRATISALALVALAFSGVAAAEQLYVNESGWWRDGGAFNVSTAPIQAAVGAADAGDAIYVHGGNYYENVDMGKEGLTLEGASADVVAVTAANSGDHVFDVTVDYVNISGFAVRGATDDGMIGIYLNNVDCCNISGNNVYGNYRGIQLSSSSNNTLTKNNANSNTEHGIRLSSSSNNALTSNTASDNYRGIYMDSSSNNNLTSNTANSNNDYGIRLSSSSNNTLTSNTASDNYRGINLGDAGDNVITCNWVQNNLRGFRLDNADNNNITCNWVQNNLRDFYLTSGSTGNNINYNNIIENGNYNTTTGGWEWQFCMGQYQPVEAKHNYWGAEMSNSTIDASIYDDEEGWGEVVFYPFETEPVPCAPTPEEPYTFTTADAVIALQIAAGSRPSDPRWDVSGDGSVTSLDALMILQAVMQAAAGNTEDPITGCGDLDQRILRMYDQDNDGRIDANWMVNASIDLDENRITQSEYDQVKYAYEHGCPVETD